MKDDPFLICGPSVISFSGGRTSAYMLWRILQSHGGALPDDVLVCFANTGREHEGTLRFVHECQVRWGVTVRWLEFRCTPPQQEGGKARLWTDEVGFNSASRNGEPFEALIRQRKFLPNPVSRFCTTELKIRTIRRWCVQQFGEATTWTQVVGLRADEPSRVDRLLDPKRAKKAGRESRNVLVPLAAAAITKADVMAFWQTPPFDLMLAGPHEGNCDGCMLKRRAFITLLAHEHPDRADWWARMEALTAQHTSGRGARFRKDWKGGYQAIIDAARDNPRLPVLDGQNDGLDHTICDIGCGA